MSFFAVLLALILEQIRPLPRDNWVHDGLTLWVDGAGRNFDAGHPHHARVVWAIAVGVPALVAWLVHWVLVSHISLLLALAFDVFVIYLCLGFRQFSHYFTDIREALEQGNEDRARQLLAEWRHLEVADLPRTEVLRHVIEHALLAAHRHVFGVFFCVVVLAALGLGPAGAILYRMAEFCSRYWMVDRRTVAGLSVNEGLRDLAQRLFMWIDYVPVRLTAFGFAVVGNFEEAMAGWRRDAELWHSPNEGILLAAAAGAVGVRLGGSVPHAGRPSGRTTAFAAGVDVNVSQSVGSTPGLPPQIGHLASVAALVWRAVILWMLLLGMLKLSNLLG
ncbi:Adenosylcobinamide-phosphate synthase cobalamin biosynthesis protein CbiB [Vitreoscilla filiformis]|uniref:Cobalamin biosynthesis protein CobD n=1 Tax=Vitreoscilla filiformis TaxID=63 RepID=A0A221KHJ1_VITFI|nr:CobD/CbiB family protein [Vitreoscilla filiformis]ASM78303.1 Adenosylcobinamide-phosphate synthase cobalamin biosynthesis protein CbiB [Vitreoscilla filiformis]